MYTVYVIQHNFYLKMPDMFRTNLLFIFRGSPFSNYISYTTPENEPEIGSKHIQYNIYIYNP
jgi:hypothetical protein